jgi:cobalamin biosynthesis Co2+ chelatase CbiK
MEHYSISRDINNHFSKFKQYTYGNNTFYNKKDYESFIKSINYEKKYKIVPIEISSKK